MGQISCKNCREMGLGGQVFNRTTPMKMTSTAALRGSIASAWFLLLLLAWAGPAAATDNYAYEKGEYVTISDGLSPDGHWSIAAHGDGELGSDQFDLHLLREPSHQKVASLRIKEVLDTGPLSFIGVWAPDSSRVAVLFRSDRRVLELRLFAVAKGKVQSIEVPSLVKALGLPRLKAGVARELGTRLYRVTWQTADRFTLEEFDGFQDSTEDGRTFTDVLATAVGGFEKGRLRLSGVERMSSWPDHIVYSPHLLYDQERGLHNTQTTLSSLAVPRGQK